MSNAQLVAIAIVLLPALAVALWPVWRRRGEEVGPASVPAADRRLELLEEKGTVYRALQELAFDHEAGHLSEEDYRGLRDRYESRAAELLAALDALGPVPREAPAPAPDRPGSPPARRSWTRHPVTLGAGATLVLLFGITIGLGVGHFAQPEQPATPTGGMPGVAAGPGPAPGDPAAAPVGPPRFALDPSKPIPPAILAGMLNAARQSLMEGRYAEAIAAYQAVLKRDPRNVDAMTHLGLIVAIGGHSDTALETFDKAAQIDPGYAPLYLYRGQVLFEAKQDYPGAVAAWRRFLSLVPSGEDHDRVVALVKEAQSKQGTR